MELMQALSLTGLMLGTVAYAFLVRRREQARREAEASGDAGLRGLVRVFAASGGYVPE